MNTIEQRSYDKAQELINLANDVLAHHIGTTRLFSYDEPYTNPRFKKLAKLERKFKKHHRGNLVDVGEYLEKFSIELKQIPNHLHDLMLSIEWLDSSTYEPLKYLEGFYSTSYSDFFANDRSTKTLHYITVKQYINLLMIDDDLRYKYSPKGLAA